MSDDYRADESLPHPPTGEAAVPTSSDLDTVDSDFSREVVELRPRLVRLAYRFLWNVHDAEEVVQDALTLGVQRLRKGTEPGQRAAWLYRTTIRLCQNRLRRRGRVTKQVSDDIRDRAARPGQTEQIRELATRVQLVIGELPERQRAALVLRDMEEMEYPQIAAIMNARPGAVRILVHRAREAVRRILLRRWPDSFGLDQ